jgi:16S rRNA (guanine527-N7)-methyltransferase
VAAQPALDPRLRKRIDELAARYGLPVGASDRLAALAELLVLDPTAPTAVRAPARVLDDHLADSLTALGVERVRRAARVADLGAGAGLPGLALAIALPGARIALVESSARKCGFLARAVASVHVANAIVVHTRIEEWEEGRGRFDVVTARALAPLAVITEYAAPLLRRGGALVAWRGQRDPGAEAEAAAAASELGLAVQEPLRVVPYPGARHRHLHLMLKAMDTPDRFPRRPGMAVKRPLGRHASDREQR